MSAVASDAQAAPVPFTAFLALSLAAFASALSLRVNDALLPKLATVFGISLGTASQVISVFATAYGLAQLFFGPVGDRFGKYRVIGWASLACVVDRGPLRGSPGFATLRIARVLAGATARPSFRCRWRGSATWFPTTQRQPMLARFLIGQILGLCAGVWLGGWRQTTASWRSRTS